MSFNASRLFYTTVMDEEHFLSEITLSSESKDALMSARTELRQALRTVASSAVSRVTGVQSDKIAPRFVTQGSVSYKTLNSPCRSPQQADLDDGIYFPLSYVKATGSPSVASDVLFEAVATAVRAVASKKGWKVKEDNPNCIRIELNAQMHIDLPMYSIPDQEFVQLREARVALASARNDSADAYDQDTWDYVESDCVLMATRDSGWLPKDPRPIRDWVERQVNKYGEQLRRTMRYVKAWRDYQSWQYGDPKSILLMVAAEAAYAPIDRRDDLALKATIRGMAKLLSGKVNAPWDKSGNPEDLAARLDEHPKLRADVVARLNTFADGIEDALDRASSPDALCNKLRLLLGDRLPKNLSAVLIATAESISPELFKTPGFTGRVTSA